MLNKSGVAVGHEDQDAIEKGVERLFDVPIELRRLKHLTLPPNLRRGMKRWIEGGIYGAIFDNLEDDLEFQDLQLFDFASLSSETHNDLLEVEMGWILRRCQGIIRDPRHLGLPKHIVLDELWKRLGILPVLSFLFETIKADRKHLAGRFSSLTWTPIKSSNTISRAMRSGPTPCPIAGPLNPSPMAISSSLATVKPLCARSIRKGETVWEWTAASNPEYISRMSRTRRACRTETPSLIVGLTSGRQK